MKQADYLAPYNPMNSSDSPMRPHPTVVPCFPVQQGRYPG